MIKQVPYPLPKVKPYSPEKVKEFFRRSGVTVAEWAEANGYTRHKVYLVLNGQNKGLWGESHKIAVALGIKIEPKTEVA